MSEPLHRTLVASLLACLFLPVPAVAVEVFIEPPDPGHDDLIEVYLTDGDCSAVVVDDLQRPAPDLFRIHLTPHPVDGPQCDFPASRHEAPALALGPLAAGDYRLDVRLGAELVDELVFTVSGHPDWPPAPEIDVTPLPSNTPNLYLVTATGLWGTPPSYMPPVSVRVEQNLIHLDAGMYESGLAAIAPWWFQTTVGPLHSGLYTMVVHIRDASPFQSFDVVTGSLPLRVPSAPAQTDCLPSATTLCLTGGRFQVSVSWDTGEASGEAGAMPLGPRSGGFWFFRQDNPELVVKVLDGCAAFGRYWVFAAGLTNVGVDVEVVDTVTGATWSHHTEPGEGFAAVRDTAAFATCP